MEKFSVKNIYKNMSDSERKAEITGKMVKIINERLANEDNSTYFKLKEVTTV